MSRFSAALRVAATITSIGDSPNSTINAISIGRSVCGLNGVPASVPAAIFIPERTAEAKLSWWWSDSASALWTTQSGISPLLPLSTIWFTAIRVGTRKVPRSTASSSASSSR
jgi:hypothetical protein